MALSWGCQVTYDRKTKEEAGFGLATPRSFEKMEKKSSWRTRRKANPT